MNTTNATSIIQSSSSSLENAAKHELNIFVAYILWLFFAAVITAGFTVLVWRSNSATHVVARDEARARIEEAQAEAEKAKERAEKAHERAQNLEKDNLKLSGEVAKVQQELAVQQERAARAEKELLQLKHSIEDRNVTPRQREMMLKFLRTRPPSSWRLVVQSLASGGREAMEYGHKIAAVFRDAGWDVEPPNGRGMFGLPISGVFLVGGINSDELSKFFADVLVVGGITQSPVGISPNSNIAAETVEIWVADKPAA